MMAMMGNDDIMKVSSDGKGQDTWALDSWIPFFEGLPWIILDHVLVVSIEEPKNKSFSRKRRRSL